MIEAIINNKFTGNKFDEDMLTSTIFGTLKYIDATLLLIPFIESAYLYDEERTPFWKKLRTEGIELRCYQDVEYIFWSSNDKYGEPDLVIIFKNHIHNHDDFLIIIEAKFKSGKSGIADKDQLGRYYKAIQESVDRFNHPSISEFKGKKGYIIYLTESEAFSEIQASIDVLRCKYIDIEDKIFHLRWYQLYNILDNIKSYNSLVEKKVVADLVKFMEALDLRNFSGISVSTTSYKTKLSNNRTIFFNL